MRLLPTTLRGTYILAGVVWLAGCAAVWAVLPIGPRAVVSADEAGRLCHFSHDGRAYLSQAYIISGRGIDDIKEGPYRVWDTATGRCIGSWLPAGPGPTPVLAPDGLSAVLTEVGRDELLDVPTGRCTRLPRHISGPVCFTADSRFLAYVTYDDGRYDTVWWDCRAGRVANIITGAYLVAMAPDGRWVCRGGRLVEDERPITFWVREPVTGRELAQFTRPEMVSELTFSPDGGHLLVPDETGIDVVAAESGRACARLPASAEVVWPAGCPEVVTVELETDACWLSRWDLSSGRFLGRRQGETTDLAFLNVAFVPARGLVVVLGSAPPGRFDGWRLRLPLVGRIVQDGSPPAILLDARTGKAVARLPLPDVSDLTASPDGCSLLVGRTDGSLEFWDLPPRKPLTWLTIAAGLWALPLAWLARRRGRHLRREVA
jgi:WD40 repeat protein